MRWPTKADKVQPSIERQLSPRTKGFLQTSANSQRKKTDDKYLPINPRLALTPFAASMRNHI